jgi:acetolactate synthase-1/2/3 large subunit
MTVAARPAARLGGHVVAESLEALGAEVVFGLPGVHALPIWEGLRTRSPRPLGFRQEVNAAFAADGYARVTGSPAPLVVSTGPGALMTLAPLMETASGCAPVVVIATQIERDAIGRGRGHLHELPDQRAPFATLVKWSGRAAEVETVPELLARAWARALEPPSGPVLVEVPVDLLQQPAEIPAVRELSVPVEPPPLPRGELLDEAARLLAEARRPLVWAGGGVQRAQAWDELLELAVRLDAPVAETYTGKGSVPAEHPLSLGSGWDERAFQEELAASDVVLCVGSSLGYDTTDTFRLRLQAVVQVDADPERIGVNYPALPLAGDARAVLRALLERLPRAERRGGAERAAAVKERIARGLAEQDLDLELQVLRAVGVALPEDAVQAWDSTILGYIAIAHLDAPRPRRFLYPAGSSTLGYAWPAALGAAAGLPGTPVLAVVGDGGFMYGLSELATARQHGLGAALLLVDDGGYGILREYQREAGFESFAVDLVRPDFAALCASFGVPARRTTPEQLQADLAWSLAEPGPAVVVLETVLAMPRPTP